MDMIEQHIITLTMGLGGWFGVLYALGAQMINGGELNAGAVARYAAIPFVSSAGAVLVVQSTRGCLMVIGSIADAMLNRVIILMFLESLLPITIVSGLALGAYLLGKAHHAIPAAAAAEVVEETVEETVEEDVGDISETHSSDMDTSSDTSELKRRVLNKSQSWTCDDCGYIGTLDEERDMCDCYEDDDSDIPSESNTCSWW
jgi:hypothetical protein